MANNPLGAIYTVNSYYRFLKKPLPKPGSSAVLAPDRKKNGRGPLGGPRPLPFAKPPLAGPLAQDGLQVLVGGADGLDGEVVHQHLEHVGVDGGRQGGPSRMSLIPRCRREVRRMAQAFSHRTRKTPGRAAGRSPSGSEGLGQGRRHLDGRSRRRCTPMSRKPRDVRRCRPASGSKKRYLPQARVRTTVSGGVFSTNSV